jgi:hypothetical protein
MIQVCRGDNSLKLATNVIIGNIPTGELVRFKFTGRARTVVREVTISPNAIVAAIKANYGSVERAKFGQLLEMILIETILIFVNTAVEMTTYAPEKIYHEWRYLSEFTELTRKDIHEGRRTIFLKHMSNEIIPYKHIGKYAFPYELVYTKSNRRQTQYARSYVKRRRHRLW